MKLLTKPCIAVSLFTLLLAGACVPPPQPTTAAPPPPSHVSSSAPSLNTPSAIVSTNRAGYRYSSNIELPDNYDINYFRKVRIAAYFEQINFEDPSKPGSLDNHTLNTLLENEISRTKRFIVYSRQSTASEREKAWQILRNSADDRFNIAMNEDLKNPEWLLEVTSILGRNKRALRGGEEAVFYVRLSAKLIDPRTMEIVHSFPPITAKSDPKRYFVSISGKYLGGFKIHDQKQLMEAYLEAANRGIAVLVNRVMNYFPVGGRVVGYYNGRFSIDKGIRDGFAKKQTVVLFTSAGGVDIPLASGVVTPAATKGSGKILAWKNDPMAQDIRKKLTVMGQDYLRSHAIYAVSVGSPQGWEY